MAAHHDLGAAAHLHVVDHVLAVVRQELGQRLLGFVHVVVGVEHRKRQFAGRHGDLLVVGLTWSRAGLVMTLPLGAA
ncbi:hypothetical protein I553_3122 [Mycobacterium xenopi 4042]|uniref:Uncharacterized protein n=1 Tax=Mycobacterium xenopi 4042 TaxID=1299334 RepID=X8E5W5_MYCXE|nr:hypothetical protein I553_3122 [Mycobacterium xenopi 4042]